MSFITFGPNESGVTYIFPSPTTKISSFDSICLFIISLSSSAKISADFWISASSANLNFCMSIVIYVPIGFPIACSPFWFVMSTLVTFKFGSISLFSISIPSISSKLLFFLKISLLSKAKSVLKLYIKKYPPWHIINLIIP